MPAPPPPSPPPPSKKERFSRFISRIKNRASRSSSGSSLVVQTGFPTSLADLVVKNRAKFRKRKQKPSRSSDLDSTASAPIRSESEGSDHPAAIPAVEIPPQIDGVNDRGKKKREIGTGIVLGFLMLVVWIVGRKWAVGGITVLTFGLLALELIGVLKPRANQRKESSEVLIGGFDLRGREVVSPIREIEVENHQNSVQLEKNEEILLKRRDLDPVDYVISKDMDLGNQRKSNRKNIFRKIFQKKNRQKKNEESSSLLNNSITSHEEVEESSSLLNDSIPSHEEVVIEEGKGGGCDDLDENRGEEFICFEASNEISEINMEDVVRDDGGEIRMRRWRIFVFVIVVLLGLLGGRGVALMVTVVWYVVLRCSGSMWKKWKERRID